MGPGLFVLLFAAFAALVILGIRRGGQIKARRNDLFALEAQKSGWRFELNPDFAQVRVHNPLPGPRPAEPDQEFFIDGRTQGMPWRMWYDTGNRYSSDGSASPAETAIGYWQCQTKRTAALALLIIPRWQYKIESSRAFGTLATVAKAFARPDAAADRDSRQAFYPHAVEVHTSNARLHDTYAILTSPNIPQTWLDNTLEELLLSIPKSRFLTKPCLIASFGAQGLRLEFNCPDVDAWNFWQQFGRLGETLAKRLG
jgi:hypothetical protein